MSNAAGKLAKRVCTKCAQTFNTRGVYSVCYPCNEAKKTATCNGCKQKYDNGGGKYSRCYTCGVAAKTTVCSGCGGKFDGKGKYTTCFNCTTKIAPCRFVSGCDINSLEELEDYFAAGGDVNDIPGFS